jgi:broad specificity phosphatase PhoE
LKRVLWAACAVALAASALGCPAERQPPAIAPIAPTAAAPIRMCNPHSVVLVRHAEKAPPVDPPDRDPDLSPKGHDRAARLMKLLGNASITRLVASEYKRTQHTLAPLADRVRRPIETRPAAQSNDLVRELRDAPPGSTTVVATHSNVIPQLVRELGGGPLARLDAEGNLPETEFGRVLILSIGCSTAASMVELNSD